MQCSKEPIGQGKKADFKIKRQNNFPKETKDKKINEKIHEIGRHRNRHGEQI